MNRCELITLFSGAVPRTRRSHPHVWDLCRPDHSFVPLSDQVQHSNLLFDQPLGELLELQGKL